MRVETTERHPSKASAEARLGALEERLRHETVPRVLKRGLRDTVDVRREVYQDAHTGEWIARVSVEVG